MERLYDSVPAKEKITIVKAIGNTGEPSCLPKLTSIILSREQPILIRKLAIYALRRIAPVQKNTVSMVFFYSLKVVF